MENTLKHKKGLVFEGGGVLGISYIGALEQLESCGCKFESFIGSSIGSLYAAAMACHMNISDMREYMMGLKLNKLKDNSSIFTGIYRLYNKYGWYSNKYLIKIVREMLDKATGNPDITFSDIHKTYGTRLTITSSSITVGKLILFDYNATPDMKVYEACVNSCTIPFYFETNGYVDGGLLNNYPIKYMNELVGVENTLGLKIIQKNNKYGTVTSFYTFCEFIINTIIDAGVKVHISKVDWENTIPINVSPNISFIDFNISEEIKLNLIESGKESVIQYLNKN